MMSEEISDRTNNTGGGCATAVGIVSLVALLVGGSLFFGIKKENVSVPFTHRQSVSQAYTSCSSVDYSSSIDTAGASLRYHAPGLIGD